MVRELLGWGVNKLNYLNHSTMKLINYNRPFPADVFRYFDDHRTKAADAYRPAVNIVERADSFELDLLAPGRVRDHFNVAFNDGVLEISYTTEKDHAAETIENFRRREFKLRDFTRTFKLDDTVINDEAIEATYDNGILHLTLPKREEALPREPRQIAVA